MNFADPIHRFFSAAFRLRLTFAFALAAVLGLLPSVSLAQSGLQNLWAYTPISSSTAIAYSPDGKLLALAGVGGVQICAASTGALIRCLPTAAAGVNGIAFSPDGSTLALGGYSLPYSDGNPVIELWNVSTGKLIHSLAAAGSLVSCVAFSPDGGTLADGRQSSAALELWNVHTGSRIATLTTAEAVVDAIQFSPDGTTLAVGGYSGGGLIELWNVATGKLAHTLVSASGEVESVSFKPDSKLLATGGYYYNPDNGQDSGSVEIWDVSSGTLDTTVPTNSFVVDSVVYSPDGKTIAVVGNASFGNNGGVELWNATYYNFISTLIPNQNADLNCVAFSPDGKTLAAFGTRFDYSYYYDDLLTVLDAWSLPSGNQILSFSPDPYNSSISVAFSPDGKSIALGGDQEGYGFGGGWIGLWNVSAAKLTTSFNSAAGFGVTSVAVSRDNSTLADCGRGYDGAVLELWSIATGGLAYTLPTVATSLSSVALSPKGNVLADGGLGYGGGVLELWNVSTGTLIASLSTEANAGVTSVAFSPDGTKLAISGKGVTAGYQFGVLEVWDVTTVKLLTSMPTNLFSLSAVAFSRDGQMIADGGVRYVPDLNSTQCTMELWSTSSGAMLSFLPVSTTSTSVTSISFAPDGQTVFASMDEGIQAFGTASYGLLASYAAGVVSQLAVSPDGTQLAYTNSGNLLALDANPFYGPTALASLSLSPNTVAAGLTSIGTATLSRATETAVVVSLASSGSAASVPESVTVAAGQSSATFSVSTLDVGSSSEAMITATLGSISKTQSLTIRAASLQSISAAPSIVPGGESCVGTVVLNGLAPTGGLSLNLSSSSTSAKVPMVVKVPAGMSSGTFTIKTVAVSTQNTVELTVKLGSEAALGSLTIDAPVLSSLSLKPSTVKGGKSSIGTVGIGSVAPAGGLVIFLASSQASAVVPKSVTIPAGKTSISFTVRTKTVSSTTSATISATLAGTSTTAVLTIS